jgi:hypothetical protein
VEECHGPTGRILDGEAVRPLKAWGHSLCPSTRICDSAALLIIPPKVLEPVRRQRRVDRGAGDRPMAEPRWMARVPWPTLATGTIDSAPSRAGRRGASDRRGVSNEIEIYSVVTRCIDHICDSHQEQRISVQRRAHDGLGAGQAVPRAIGQSTAPRCRSRRQRQSRRPDAWEASGRIAPRRYVA